MAPDRNRAWLATCVLLGVCVIWGSTFLLMEAGTDALRACYGDTPLTNGAEFLAVRFIIAAAAMPILVRGCVAAANRQAWTHGFWLSLVFSAAFLTQIFGLAQEDVHPSQSAYLTSLTVVATPLIGAAVYRKLPPIGVVIAIPLALLGAAFIAGPPSGGLSVGAWSTVACAILFGGQILLTDYSSRKVNTSALTFTMLTFSAGWMTLALLAAPGGIARLGDAERWCPLRSPSFIGIELACALIATVLVVTLFTRWQKELNPSRVAILYTTEPIFAAAISIVAGRDRLTGWLVFGATMILAANLVAELVGSKRIR
jgi:drug/metabolite transporter (DMT)-like permease